LIQYNLFEKVTLYIKLIKSIIQSNSVLNVSNVFKFCEGKCILKGKSIKVLNGKLECIPIVY
jgi:hypothetical protein